MQDIKESKQFIAYAMKSYKLGDNVVEVPLSTVKRRELLGNLGTHFAKWIYKISNLAQSGYIAPNICKDGQKTQCKIARIFLEDLYLVYLLVTGDKRVIKNESKDFVLTEPLNITPEEMEQTLIREYVDKYKDDFKKGLTIEDYKETECGRVYHELQNVKSGVRDKIMKELDYKHTGDIKSAIGTVLYQECGKEYNPQLITEIAKETGIERKNVKKAVNSLFFGSNLHYYKSEVFKDIEYTVKLDVLLKLSNNEKFCKLKSEIKEINQQIDTKRYFNLERKITNCFYEFIKKQGGNTFLIHDGFYSTIEYSVKQLEDYIKQDTGFSVVIEKGTLI